MAELRKPRVVAVTGGIASGKTTVVHELERLGGRVVESDRISRAIYTPGSAVWKKIVRLFGRGILGEDDAVDRKKLAGIVFADPKRRRTLEKVTHPAIIAEMKRQMRAAKDAPLIVLDIPLLYEAGLEGMADITVVVWVPKAVQAARLRKRDGLAAQDAAARLRAQWPLARKRALADYVIDNTGGKARTKRETAKLWRVLTKTF
jgi:dephospho-CoA kinase